MDRNRSESMSNVDNGGGEHDDDDVCHPHETEFREQVSDYWQNEFHRRSVRLDEVQANSLGTLDALDNSTKMHLGKEGQDASNDECATKNMPLNGDSVEHRKETNGFHNERDSCSPSTYDDTAKDASGKISQAGQDEVTKQELRKEMQQTVPKMTQAEKNKIRQRVVRNIRQHDARETSQVQKDEISKRELREEMQQAATSWRGARPNGTNMPSVQRRVVNARSFSTNTHVSADGNESNLLLEPGQEESPAREARHVGDMMASSPLPPASKSFSPKSPEKHSSPTSKPKNGVTTTRRTARRITLADIERQATKGYNTRTVASTMRQPSSPSQKTSISRSSVSAYPTERSRVSSRRCTLSDLEDDVIKGANTRPATMSPSQRRPTAIGMPDPQWADPKRSESTCAPTTSLARANGNQGESQPGAFPVEGTNVLGRRLSRQNQPYTSPTVTRASVAISPNRRTSHAYPVAAILVHEDESRELSKRELDIQQKEEWLKQQMEKLSAWEQKLEQKQQQLDYHEETVVEAVPLADSKPAGIGFGFPSIIRRGSGDHLRGSGENLQPRGLPSLIRQRSGDNRGSGDNLLARAAASLRGSNDSQTISSTRSPRNEAWEVVEPEDEPTELGFYTVEAKLGAGPMRFAQKSRRSVDKQVAALSPSDRRCFKNLKQRWEDFKAKRPSKWSPYTDEMILRFARNTARKSGFYEDRAYGAMKKMRAKWAKISIHRMESQLLSKTLFPIPGLKSQAGHDMFYMRPSRYFPKETSTKTVIENLAYVMNCMLEKESNCRDGIGFLACMDDWKMKNFEVNYCYQFMMTLQGYIIPVRVQLFLIVNPPSWFGAIWKIMKPMLVPSFRKKVKMIHESQLPKYLQAGFENFLPDDMDCGTVDTEVMVKDFVTFRKHHERTRYDTFVVADLDRESAVSDHVSDQVSETNMAEYAVGLNDGASYSSGHSSEVVNRPASCVSLGMASTSSRSHSQSHSHSQDSDDLSCHVWSDDEDSIGSDGSFEEEDDD